MYIFRFDITKEDIDAHVKNSLSEEEREKFKNVKFIPFKVHCNKDMNIEITAIGVLDLNEDKKGDNEEIIASHENN